MANLFSLIERYKNVWEQTCIFYRAWVLKSISIHEAKLNHRQNNPWAFLRSPLQHSVIVPAVNKSISDSFSCHTEQIPIASVCGTWSLWLTVGAILSGGAHIHPLESYSTLWDTSTISVPIAGILELIPTENSRLTFSISCLVGICSLWKKS